MVAAPCSANTLAKMANGLCDDLLSCIVRAWDFNDPYKRMVIAPAMNTMMWESPFTRKHLATLVELGGGTMDDQNRVVIVGPVEKTSGVQRRRQRRDGCARRHNEDGREVGRRHKSIRGYDEGECS